TLALTGYSLQSHHTNNICLSSIYAGLYHWRRSGWCSQFYIVLYPSYVYSGMDISRNGLRISYGLGTIAHYRGIHCDSFQIIKSMGVLWGRRITWITNLRWVYLYVIL